MSQRAGSLNNSRDNLHESKKLQVSLNEQEGYFLIGKYSPNSQTYVLTITIAFARNLLRVS